MSKSQRRYQVTMRHPPLPTPTAFPKSPIASGQIYHRTFDLSNSLEALVDLLLVELADDAAVELLGGGDKAL